MLSAIIAGGGLAGLTSATALARTGWKVTLFERQPEIRAHGSGIYIWENGLRVLETLGAYEDAIAGSFKGEFFEQRDRDNHVIQSERIASDKRLMSPPRSNLLNALHKACHAAGVEVVTGCAVVGATPRGELSLSNGRTVRADLAVGADGVWSSVRTSLGLESLRENSPEGAIRTIVPTTSEDFGPNDRHKYIETWNGNCRFLITPITKDTTYLAMTCPASNTAARAAVDGTPDFWLEHFPAWKHLIARVGTTDADISWGVYTDIKCSSWSAGRTAVLGDAGHAQHPNLGQGGGMAMQNALSLAAELKNISRAADIPAALERWEGRERQIVDHCQYWSHLYGQVATLPDEVRIRVVNGAMGDPWIASQVWLAANHIPYGSRDNHPLL